MLLWMLFLLAFGDRRHRTDKTPREGSYTSTTETPNPTSSGIEPQKLGTSIPSPPTVGPSNSKGQITNASLHISTPSHDPSDLATLYSSGKTSATGSEASNGLTSTSETPNLIGLDGKGSDGTTLFRTTSSTTSVHERKDPKGLVFEASDFQYPRSSYVSSGKAASSTVPGNATVPRNSSSDLPMTSTGSDEITTPIPSSPDAGTPGANSPDSTSIAVSSGLPVPGSYSSGPTESKSDSSNLETYSTARSVLEPPSPEPKVLTAFIADLSDIKKSITGTREGKSNDEATIVCKNLPQWQKMCLKEADLRHLCLKPQASKFVCSKVPQLTNLCSELRITEALCSKSDYHLPKVLETPRRTRPTSEGSNDETDPLRPDTETADLVTLTSKDPTRSVLQTLAMTCSNPPDNLKLLCSTLPQLLMGKGRENCSPKCELNFFINNFYLDLTEDTDATEEENEKINLS